MNYDPHHMAMLAGINRRPDYGLARSTIKSRLGSVVDLQEGKEMEMIRSNITEKTRELVGNNIHALHKFFRENDPHDTGTTCRGACLPLAYLLVFFPLGYVPQHKFRQVLEMIGAPIEVPL